MRRWRSIAPGRMSFFPPTLGNPASPGSVSPPRGGLVRRRPGSGLPFRTEGGPPREGYLFFSTAGIRPMTGWISMRQGPGIACGRVGKGGVTNAPRIPAGPIAPSEA